MFEVRSGSPQSTINTQTPYFNADSPEEIVRVTTRGRKIEDLLKKEWLLTNSRGSFASSTVVGGHTSGYHGLLVGSPDPLVRRLMTLSNCLEMLLWNGPALELSTFEFSDRFAPQGYTQQQEFRRDIGAHFLYRTQPADLCKSVYLARDTDTVLVEYTFEEVREPVDFVLRPFVGMRDFHTLQRSGAPLTCRITDNLVHIQNAAVPDCGLLLSCPPARFQSDPQWWFNFIYRVNRDRGLSYREDLWAPGFFKTHIEGSTRFVFWAHLGAAGESEPAVGPDAIKEDLRLHQQRLWEQAAAREKTHRILCLAADQFVVKRRSSGGDRTTVVAGYPWFADWGRDTFLSLPGLLLATGRHKEAGSVLSTFAAAADRGMIPNRFDDRTGEAQFNSVDASLWFIHAAFEYLEAAGNVDEFSQRLLPAIRGIIDAYQAGTHFGIHADADGLITAGDQNTQLTWMDAKCDGIAFTPRYGKAVEINALWHNALLRLQRFCEGQQLPEARRYAAMAEQAGRSFCKLFWNAELGYLNDVVLPDGTVDASLRPNQIFAVALPFGPPLTRAQQWAVVNTMEQKLLTPYGPRTLSSRDPAYKGRYEGSPRCRDEAYHQGTVWPYLMGPFLEAYLKVRGHSVESKSDAAEFLRPLLRHLVEDGCLGSISEVFDGDPPHRPAGCPAQAWSVAEILRIYHMVTTE
ncbi:MAG: amylo-alpha-1,6-glucosidase [Planctomycetes bacterium]|nr:amylo-alpha-1,6-glucosidase [Planctomycetota bacterium]